MSDFDGRVLVGGEALVDLVLARDGTLAAHLGGGPFNAARTLARLGVPAAFLGALSRDRFGRDLRERLRADGVELDCAQETQHPTTLALAELDATGAATYRFYAAETSAPALHPEAARAALAAAPVAALHVGTLGLVLEPMATALEAAVEASGRSAFVFVDPNCRPTHIPDRDEYVARLGRVLRAADVVKASEDDLAYLHPGLGPVAAARALLEDGPALALVTRGGDGVDVVTPHWHASVPAPRVVVADTVGAGDSFGGGWLAWWLAAGLGRDALAEREPLLAAAAFACRVAAITCSRPGASPPRIGEEGLEFPPARVG